MAIDHLVFNKQNFYRLYNQVLGNMPSSISIPAGTNCKNVNSTSEYGYSQKNQFDTVKSVVGVKNILYEGKYYMVSMSMSSDFGQQWQGIGSGDTVYCWIKADDVTPKWGGNSLLTHLYQALRCAFTSRNEARACI